MSLHQKEVLEEEQENARKIRTNMNLELEGETKDNVPLLDSHKLEHENSNIEK
jgi:hypothetical protein